MALTQKARAGDTGSLRTLPEHGKAPSTTKSPHRQWGSRRQAWPDAVLPHAYLSALACWATRQANNASAKIVFPTGVVSVGKVRQVLRALRRIGPREGRQFERLIEQHIMAPRYDWPPVPTERHRCTQAAALMLATAEARNLAALRKKTPADAGSRRGLP